MDQVVEPTQIHASMPRAEAEKKAVALFRELALPDPDTIGARYPHQVSGGQLQRLMAAMALITDPDLVILDEPTTALDVTTQAQILSLIREIQSARRMAVLFITHDFGVVAEIADRIAVMQRGRLVEQGGRATVLQSPHHSYTRTLLAAVPDLAPRAPRADFRGSDPVRLFDSVQSKLMKLPDATVVLSGHGYQDVLFTTIGHERAHNAALKHPNAAAYAKSLNAVEGRGNTPEVDVTLETNLSADPHLPEGPQVVAACCSMGGAPIAGARIREQRCDELAPRRADLVAKHSWIDVRDPWEWKAGRIPGVPNFPLSELGFHLDELKQLAPTVISCRSGARSMTAAKTLTYLGVLRDPISMAGGFGKWEEMKLPVEK